ncbi:DUF4145 domain-containing protein [Bdellovibrio sp.]|uniref:DUF4145 domain-containing protein n=1 Tax=Bdellovibrio sp. TaxID=28201 RepID=UPI003221E374
MGTSWHCPHCDRSTTIGDNDRSESTHRFYHDTKIGLVALRSYITVCPNASCKEPSVVATLNNYKQGPIGGGHGLIIGKQLGIWGLRPDSAAKVMPPYIPPPIVEDYTEACKIKNLSPKASATLSRRCLQGMIRDFWGIKKSRLVDEIEALRDKVDPLTWESIDAIRKVGNIGAHMEKDIDLIIEVDPDEAALLIQLIEGLVEDWYVAKWKREENKRKMIELAKEKEEAKKKVST